MITDLQPSHPDICYSKYADDLTAVIPAAISHLAVSEFRHINDWSATNKLLINLSKTKEMIICRPGNRAKPTLAEPITGIEQIHTIKLLGWRRGSVVRTSVRSWRTFPDLRLIHG